MSEQLGLFGPVPPTSVAVPKRVPRCSYTNFTGRTQCTHCVIVVHEGGTEPIRMARFKRTTPDGELWLCQAHRDIQRAADVKAKLIGAGRDDAPIAKNRQDTAR